MRLKDYLVGFGMLTAVFSVGGLESRLYAEEKKEAPWKEAELVQELSPSEYENKILGYERAALVLVTATRFGDVESQRACENMWKVYQSLAGNFHGKRVNGLSIKFYWVNITQPDTDEDENLVKKINTMKLTTIMYKAGKFKSLEEKELDRMSCGPKNEEWIDTFVESLSLWIDLNLIHPRNDYTGFHKGGCELLKVYKK